MKSAESLPNLLVIGGQKCGSTWLHERLEVHPEIFMSNPKELRFFGHKGKTDSEEGLADYRAHFAAGAEQHYRGESTPAYFWSYDENSPWAVDLKRSNLHIPPVVRRILGPEVKLILSLRDPVQRAISAFHHHLRAGNLEAEDTIRQQGHRFGIIDMGFYRRHLEAWLEYFDPDQLHLVLFDDIATAPDQVCNELFDFLSLSATAEDPARASKSNAADPSSQLAPSPEDMEFLAGLYEEDIEFIAQYTGRELSHWGGVRSN